MVAKLIRLRVGEILYLYFFHFPIFIFIGKILYIVVDTLICIYYPRIFLYFFKIYNSNQISLEWTILFHCRIKKK